MAHDVEVIGPRVYIGELIVEYRAIHINIVGGTGAIFASCNVVEVAEIEVELEGSGIRGMYRLLV